jgi:hypothetical protein
MLPDCINIEHTLHRGGESYDVCLLCENEDGTGGDILTKQELTRLPDRFILKRVSTGHTDDIEIFPPDFANLPEDDEESCFSYPFSRF